MRRLFLALSLCAICADCLGEIIPADRRITWQGNVGIPGGIPNRTTISATLSAGATQAQIQSALNAAAANTVVKLNPGTYNITSRLNIPSNVTLRGSGPANTILNMQGSGMSAVNFGPNTGTWEHQDSPYVSITGGATKGSTSITVSSASGIVVGGYLQIDQINDNVVVNNVGGEGTQGMCGIRHGQSRHQSQIAEVTAINGTTITLAQPLFTDYTRSPEAVPFTAQAKYAGLEDLKLYANNTGYELNFSMLIVAYCWVKNIESDYADGDHGWVNSSYRCEIRDSYFHDGYLHGPGSHDDTIQFQCHSTSHLVENNIMRRMHCGIMLSSGGGGHVIAYNFINNNFDTGSPAAIFPELDYHGTHVGYVLWEGNVCASFNQDGTWGTASHGTALRNVITGLNYCWPPFTGRSAENPSSPTKQYAPAWTVNLAGLGNSWYFNFVGNCLGAPTMGNYPSFNPIFRVVAPANREYDHNGYIWTLGYQGTTNSGNSTPYDTLLDHGNYDVVNNTQTWAGSISDHVIPSSYYLTSKPAFFGNMTWPANNPASPPPISSSTGRPTTPTIPAHYRNVNGVPPPPDNDTTPPAISSAVVNSSGTSITLSFNENVQIGSGGSSGWTISPSGGAATLSAPVISSNTISFTISRIILVGETGTVSYTQPGNGVEDSSGNDLATLSGFSFTNQSTVDLTAPTPNPMTFSVLPNATGSSSITMTATTATDASSPPVQYFFDETSGNSGGTDSAWQSSPTYVDTGLTPGVQYTYRVKARDAFSTPNETALSASASATTSIISGGRVITPSKTVGAGFLNP